MAGRSQVIMVQREAKKKTRNCITSAVLLLIMIASMTCVIGSASVASGSPVGIGAIPEEELDPNSYASLLAGRLLDTFYTTLPNGTGVLNYPVEYAGAYIDSFNMLHIVLSKYATNSTIDIYHSIIGDPEVIFEIAEFPLSSLYEAQHALNGAMISFCIDISSVNEITNRLDLYLENSTKQSEILQYLTNKVADFDERCITFLGPNPITATEQSVDDTAGLAEIHPPTSPNDGFLGTNLPTIYGAAAVAIIAVTVALVCYLAFVRHDKTTELN